MIIGSVAKLGLLGRLLGIGPPPRRVMSTRPKNLDLVKIGQKSDKLGQTRAYSVLLGPTRSNSANSVKIGQTRSKGQNCHKKRKKIKNFKINMYNALNDLLFNTNMWLLLHIYLKFSVIIHVVRQLCVFQFLCIHMYLILLYISIKLWFWHI